MKFLMAVMVLAIWSSPLAAWGDSGDIGATFGKLPGIPEPFFAKLLVAGNSQYGTLGDLPFADFVPRNANPG
jgi:hypothetical protein